MTGPGFPEGNDIEAASDRTLVKAVLGVQRLVPSRAPPAAIYQAVVDGALDLRGCDGGSLRFVDLEDPTWSVAVAWHGSAGQGERWRHRAPITEGLSGRVIATGKPIALEDYRAAKTGSQLAPPGPQAIIEVPILERDRAIGSLVVGTTIERRSSIIGPQMTIPTRPELAELTIADPPERWRGLGFTVDAGGHIDLGGVRITLGGDGAGITSWSLRGIAELDSIDGLQTFAPSLPEPPPLATHPNGATGLDHIVVLTGDLGRTAFTLERLGMPLKYTRAINRSRGFVRIGPAILELVHVPQMNSPDACFWGLAIVVEDLDELAARLRSRLGRIKAAIQPGRRIATLAASAGCSTAVAFMTPRPT